MSHTAKKRIFIAMHYMELGGAEISLIGLLQALDYRKYDVDLFLHSHQGELMAFIPKEVRLLPELKPYAYIERPMKEALRHGQWTIVMGRLWAKWQFRRYACKHRPKDGSAILQYVARGVERFLPSLHHLGTYVLAVSFLHPHNYVLSKVLAKKKICWIHTDYSTIEVNAKMELPVWAAYDYVVSISPDVTKAFLQVFPSLAEKIILIENILPPTFVRGRAEAYNARMEMDGLAGKKDSVKILSIGRFSHQKNFDNVPDICRRIIAQGTDVYWYLIGYGGDEALIRQKIHEAGMQEHVIILGKRTNPYPYIKACDIYCQPSRYEGKSVTVREAQMLYKPVVVTNYPTASSQIADGLDGVIVPMDNEGCAQGISDLINNKELQQRMTDYLHSHDYGNVKEVEKIDHLIE